jgi:hypothetical protein
MRGRQGGLPGNVDFLFLTNHTEVVIPTRLAVENTQKLASQKCLLLLSMLLTHFGMRRYLVGERRTPIDRLAGGLAGGGSSFPTSF